MNPRLVNVLSLLVSMSCAGNASSNGLTKLHLLNILPFPVDQLGAGWDRGYELLPAAQIAQDYINNNSNLLQGYSLEVVTVRSEPCGLSSVNDGLVNSYAKVLDPQRSLNVVGLTGLFCSSVTNTLGPIFSFPSVTYLQVAASTAPEHRNNGDFQWLVHLLSSSVAFNDAVLAMMNTFGWTRTGLIYDSLGVFFRGIATEFEGRFLKNNFTLTSSLPISKINFEADYIFRSLVNQGTKVVVVIASVPEAVNIMCNAYQRNAMYPGYVYIFQSRILSEFISNANFTDCTQEQMQQVMEGVFLIEYSLVVNKNTTLVSGLTYKEYHQEYTSRLSELAPLINYTVTSANIYANVMHDEIWTFALALNASLPDLQGKVDLEDVTMQQSPVLADALRRVVANVSFQGASGFIKFDPNRDGNSEINIFQVINGKQVVVATYNSDQGFNLTLLKNITPPGDTFERINRTLPLWLSTTIGVLTSFCFIFTTAVLFALLWFRNRPEVKASSIYLNLLIFTGCYFTYIGSEMRTLSRGYVISNEHAFNLICNLELWFANTGMNLIFSTLFVRLFRIRQIFFYKKYGRQMNYLKDQYLILVVLFLCGIGIIILIPWTIFDRLRKTTTVTYIPDASPPHFEVHSTCDSDHLGIWLATAFAYVGMIIAVVVFMAIQTRKIKRSNFKDTKKIIAYVFITVITLCILMPLWAISDSVIMNDILGHIFISLAFIAVGFFCQLFVFVPQIFLAINNHHKEQQRRSSGVPEYKIRPRETQFSKL